MMIGPILTHPGLMSSDSTPARYVIDGLKSSGPFALRAFLKLVVHFRKARHGNLIDSMHQSDSNMVFQLADGTETTRKLPGATECQCRPQLWNSMSHQG